MNDENMEDNSHTSNDNDGNEMDQPQEQQVSQAKRKRKLEKPRGPSKGLKSIPGLKRVLEWDQYNRPIGKWVKDYSKHCGEISRSKVSILIDKWAEVPQGITETLWEDVKREFHIEDNEEKKDKVLQSCDKKWRDFKTKLVSRWITFTRKKPKNERLPYEMYPYITKDIWEQFETKHKEDTFMEKSEKARESQSFNEHPHFCGQMSLAQKEPIWRRKGYIPTSFPVSSCSSSSHAVSSLPERTYVWILARSKEDDKGNLFIPNASTKTISDEIDKWRRKEKEGDFIPSRLDDSLSRALNKKDRSGRVLAVGGQVNIRSYWGPCGQRSNSQQSKSLGVEDLEEFEARVSERVREQTLDEVNSRLDDMVKDKFIILAKQFGLQVPNEMSEHEVRSPLTRIRSSCHSGGGEDDPFVDLQEPVSCNLAIFDNVGNKIIVGNGTIMPTMKTTTPDNVKLTVDDYDVAHEDAIVPVPTSYIQKIKSAVGALLEWPKTLVVLCNDKEINEQNVQKKKCQDLQSGGIGTNESAHNPKRSLLLEMALENTSEKCQYMHDLVAKLPHGGCHNLIGDTSVFHYEKNQMISVTYDDIVQLLTGAWLNVSILQVSMMDLYASTTNDGVTSIGFMCPNLISSTMIHNDADGSCRYMSDAILKQRKKRFIFCPYHEKNHWLLLVLCPSRNEVYVFDPLKKKRSLSINYQLNNAFRNFKAVGGNSSRVKLTWKNAQCAQQSGGRECGYYVIRYMIEISESYHGSEDLIVDYARTKPYSDEEISEVRERFAEYFVGNIEEF